MDITKKFIELTKRTEVYGQESALRSMLPDNLEEDTEGNYWTKIGESDTMFTSHLDTAAFSCRPVTHVFETITTKSGRKEEFVETDKTTLLGADDRTGIVIMLYMMEHKIPGLYYFFVGEESGTIGSSGILRSNPDFFKDYKKCISFDRRGYGSVITDQMGGQCCSDVFADDLVKKLTNATGYNHKKDNTGIYTDSAVFMNDIPECTNLSVGYFNEHSVDEFQNLTYLKGICEGFVKVDWESLPIARRIDLIKPISYGYNSPSEDFTENELNIIFTMVEDVLDETHSMDCEDRHLFEADKEMTFISYLDETKKVPVIIYHDGSISIGSQLFDDITELEEVAKKKFGYVSKWIDADSQDDMIEQFPDDEDGDINMEENTFEQGIDIDNFLMDVSNLKSKTIGVNEISSICEKYDKNLNSLIVWIFNKGNDPFQTQGLTWDTDENCFEFDSEYFVTLNDESDYKVNTNLGARDFND